MKSFSPKVWILDPDFSVSVKMLTTKFLTLSASNCCKLLLTDYLYVNGLRRQKTIDYYVAEDSATFIERYFPDWPFAPSDKNHLPNASLYRNPIAKWTRKCLDHHQYIQNYLVACLSEYSYRKTKPSILDKYLDWFILHPISLPAANLDTIMPSPKGLPIQYRTPDYFKGIKAYYLTKLVDPLREYADSRRDIPEFVMKKFVNFV